MLLFILAVQLGTGGGEGGGGGGGRLFMLLFSFFKKKKFLQDCIPLLATDLLCAQKYFYIIFQS